MSFFLDPAHGGITQPFVFANGTFTRISEWDDPCGGRQSHVKLTGTMTLPQPPQDPVNVISGHGNAIATGGGRVNATYDQVMNRTGD